MTLKHATIAVLVAILPMTMLSGCGEREKITNLSQLEEKEFAVPTGTVADKLVLSVLPKAKFKYFNSVADAALAVKSGKADAVAYDEPILRNIAAKQGGLAVLGQMITFDNYAFAVRLDDLELKSAIDGVVADSRADGTEQDMRRRWFPENGSPAPMPDIPDGEGEVLRLGTASVTEPFSFVDGSGKVVGYDIELARKVANRLGRKLEVVDMEFGALIPALVSGKIDMIAACITVTEERSKQVLFSEPYYTGGIGALVRK